MDAGLLQLNKSPGVNAIPGNLTILTNSGSTVRWMASDQIADSAVLSVSLAANTADLNGQNETLSGINMAGGTLALGSGTMTVTGALAANTSTSTAIISGSGMIVAGSLNAQSNLTRSGGGTGTKINGMPTIATGKNLDLVDTKNDRHRRGFGILERFKLQRHHRHD